MITLSDLGFWARYTFDHRAETSAKDLEVTSDMVGWDYLVKTFIKVTGQPAIYKRLSLDEWWGNFVNVDRPLAIEPVPDGSTTMKENFSCFWRQFRDDILTRDMDWIRSIHPKTHTLESWMKATNYTGRISTQGVLKNIEDGKGFQLNQERAAEL